MRAKARSYRLTPLAERDLEDIWLYTCRTWSSDQADRYHSILIQTLEGLASGVKAGCDASEIRDGYRRQMAGRHVLFYRERDDHIAVIRILHQSMDLPAQLGADQA